MTVETLQETPLIEMLRADHRRMKSLFSEFERSGEEGREDVCRELLSLIHVHDQIEKKLLYPNAEGISRKAGEIVMRSEEAHHLANVLVAELNVMPYGPRYFAKMAKLIEGVRMHMQEEENELFPLVEDSELDLRALGEKAATLRAGVEMMSPMAGGMAPVRFLAAAAAVVGIGMLLVGLFGDRD